MQNRYGPTAVTEDETCNLVTCLIKWVGKAQGVGRSGSQKTGHLDLSIEVKVNPQAKFRLGIFFGFLIWTIVCEECFLIWFKRWKGFFWTFFREIGVRYHEGGSIGSTRLFAD